MPNCLDYDRVKELYLSGMTTKQVGEVLGRDPETIRKALIKMDIPRRQDGWRKGKERALDISRETLYQLYWEESRSSSEIAAMYNVTPSAIHVYLKRLNIDARPSGGQRGNLNASWKGGRTIDKSGYVLVLVGKENHPYANSHGYVREHRLVMEKKIGRYLDPQEVVHHIDGDKQNNHPSNLELYASNAEHLKDELTGRVPNWSPEGRQNILSTPRRLPEWTEERRSAHSQIMKKTWAEGKMAREYTPDLRRRLSLAAKRQNASRQRDRYGRFLPESNLRSTDSPIESSHFAPRIDDQQSQ